MQLYNTKTRRLEHFTPQDENRVGLYTCGPTVYDYQHIGNYATYIRWDLLVRVLKESGYTVDWVMNITDVGHLTGDVDEGEDKLQKGANREGKTAWDIAEFYTKDFFRNLHDLHVQQPTHTPRATQHIPQQIKLVQALEKRGHTYIIDDGVYFDTATFPAYGELAKLKLDSLQAGARVGVNPQKRSPWDFALWKFTPKGQKRDMEWDSPWGKGFPGWHIECSAMSMEYLGSTLDIHAGGIDHLPVHHVNEIAQSEAATGVPFANYWLHSNHIMIDGAKIAKSDGNGITPHDLSKQGFSPLDLRLLFLQSHYRSSANFSRDALQAAHKRRLALQAFADLRFQLKEGAQLAANDFSDVQAAMLTELQNDLRTPEAFAALSGLVDSAETYLVAPDAKQAFDGFLAFLDRIFGLQLAGSTDITAEQKELIAKREQARGAKDFEHADTYRQELAAQNIELRDTPLGSIWQRR
ncbi:MAG TPA: cysteine--tRNA ligase [Candidatus Saccharimonadales bacterium]|nr:cysteine--tRNA ligase [Candidatus Saccharimonadales bacterium]